MRISDWSSDVCSSDLARRGKTRVAADALVPGPGGRGAAASRAHAVDRDRPVLRLAGDRAVHPDHLHPDLGPGPQQPQPGAAAGHDAAGNHRGLGRSEEHTSELQSLMRISYAVFCLKKKITKQKT